MSMEIFMLLKTRRELLSSFPHKESCSRQQELRVESIPLFDSEGNPLSSLKSKVICPECEVEQIGSNF